MPGQDPIKVTRTRFADLSPRAYQHPADRGASAVLRAVPGVTEVLKTAAGAFPERGERLMALASCIRVGPSQYPHLHQMRLETAEILGLEKVPEVFVERSPELNAYAIGMDQPFIVVTTALLDVDHGAQRFVIGHEMGHVHSEHVVLRTLLIRLLQLGAIAGAIPAGLLGLRVVIAALMEWFRKAELTADRAGLLATQDPQAALRAHAYMAGATDVAELDLAAFLRQAEEYLGTDDLRDSLHKLRQVEMLSHPLAVVRAAELQRWAASADYHQLLTGDYQRRSQDRGARDLGDDLLAAAKAYKDGAKDTMSGLVGALNNLGENLTRSRS